MANNLDTKKFSEMIKSKRGKQGLRALANEIGVSASTLSRIEQGNLPDIDTYITLCEWLSVSTDFFVAKDHAQNEVTSANVIAHLRADKSLRPETAEALIQMINIAYASSKKTD